MSLRFKLLLVALSTLVLPWAGWQFVRQAERLLREGQEQAWLASARMLAKAVEAKAIPLPPAGPVHALQAGEETIVVDGYADDWTGLRDYAQAVGPATDAQRLRVTLARVRGDVYLLAEARDATRARFDPADPRAETGDAIELVLVLGGESRNYLLTGAAPGAFESPARGSGAGLLPERLAGALQEDGSGYRVELRLPRGVLPERIGFALHDSAATGSGAPAEARPLLAYDTIAARALQPLIPEHARARLVAADGWVVADAGTLAAEGDAQAPGAFANFVYRVLVAPTFGGSAGLDGRRARLDAAEVWQALSGVPATSWRAARGRGAVVLTAATPLRAADGLHGALVLEQANRALPLLANRAFTRLALATLVALATAAAILLLFGASLSLRIRRLRNAAERAVRTSGRLDGPMPLADAPDELGDLARSFGRLVDEVAAYTDYLRTLASKLSHELNTPLAIVKSSLDNLDHHALPADARPYLARARDGAERLGTIVRAMSEASRIERAIASAEAEDLDLRALVAGCAEGYRALCGGRPLRVALPDAPLPFHGAPDLLAQALDKLFDNACSFAPADGWIALSLDAAADGARLRVANSGPLLPAAMQERLFDSLVSLRERATRGGEAPHLGLGLYVVRLVAELHRGRAIAANRAEGDGVEFTLRMPGMPRRRLADGTA